MKLKSKYLINEEDRSLSLRSRFLLSRETWMRSLSLSLSLSLSVARSLALVDVDVRR